MPPGSGQSAASDSSRPSASRYSTTKNGRPPLSRWSRAPSSPLRPAARDELRHVGGREAPEREHARRPVALRLGEQPRDRMLGRDRLGLPAHDEQERPPGEAVREEEQEPRATPRRPSARRRRARLPAARCRARSTQERADRLVEAHLRGGAVDRARGRRPELGHEARDLLDPPRRVLRRPARRERVAQQPADDAVGQLGLLLEAARRTRGAPGRGDLGQQLAAEPRLADPRLADEHGEPAVGPDRAVRLAQRVAARGRGRRAPRRAPARAAARRRGRDRSGGALEHGVVERRRLVERAHAELAVEHAHAVAVLLERGRAVAARPRRPGSAAGARARAAGRARGGAGRSRSPAAWSPAAASASASRSSTAPSSRPQQVAGELLPVVELGRVAQAEAGEERPAVERGRRAQRLEAALARLAGRVPVRRALGDEPPQLGDVEPDALAAERDELAVGLEPAAAERGAQRRERAPQRRARALRVVLGPEQRRDRVAAQRMRPRSRGRRAAPSPCACRPRAGGRRPRRRAGRAGRSRAAAPARARS